MPRVFDGVNDYLTGNDPVAAAPLSFAAWFAVEAGAAGTDTVVAIAQAAGVADNYWELQADTVNTDTRAGADAAGAGDVASESPATWTAGTWVHGLVVDNDSGAADLTAYQDATPDATPETMPGNPANIDTLSIGARANAARPFKGSVFWVGAWNAAVNASDTTPSSAQRLAWGIEPIFVRRESLVFYAPLWAGENQDYIGGLTLTNNDANTFSTASYPNTMIRAAPRGRGRDRHRFT